MKTTPTLNSTTAELIAFTNKEIILAFGFVPVRVKKERSRLANFCATMPKNQRPEYFSHFNIG